MADSINLAVTDYRTSERPVPVGAHKVSVQIQPNTTDGWGSAVVTLEYKIDDGKTDQAIEWQGFGTAVTFSSSSPSQRKVSVTGATHISLRTSTADGDADPSAEYVVVFS